MVGESPDEAWLGAAATSREWPIPGRPPLRTVKEWGAARLIAPPFRVPELPGLPQPVPQEEGRAELPVPEILHADERARRASLGPVAAGSQRRRKAGG